MGVLGQNDTLAFQLSQPLRVESGAIELLLTISWDYRLQVASEGIKNLSLSPSGREMILEAAFKRSIPCGWFGLNLFGRHEPGHVKHEGYDIGLAMRADLTL